jgi:ribosomal-protein-alanine N-acetyltransferase
MSILIRSMMRKDVSRVYTLEKEIFKDAWSYQMIFDETDGQFFRKPFVMEESGKIIGYAFIWVIEDELHLNNFAIHPDFRLKGLGLKLISFIFDTLKGYKNVYLEVRASNSNAILLYKKVGFKEFAIRKSYYSDNEDAIVMLKEFK